jgi:putative transposase
MVTKKIKGIKRHIAVDSDGLLLDVIVDKANEHDSQKLLPLIAKVKQHTPFLLETVLADSGYKGYESELKERYKITLDIKPNLSKSGFKVIDRRWVVERSFSWMKGYRRLAKDYEKSPSTSEVMVKLTFAKINLRKLSKINKILSG